MVRKTITFLFPFYLIFVLLTSCDITGKNRKKPASTGQPYEVVLEGDTDSIVTKMLTEDVTGLPQPEPLCRLIQVKKGKTQAGFLRQAEPRRKCCTAEYHPHYSPLDTAVAGKAQWRKTPPNRE